uniref:Uncharacterized protein n=1 Tax=viral metagenome TaxID=1070528 RepID=A0A6C0HVM8_9ZZZZ
MENSCEELLKNIQKCLHKCNSNKKIIEIEDIINFQECNNIQDWYKTVKESTKLKIYLKKSILKEKYSIEYNVNKRLITIG